jgi:hypothetical protein
VKKNPKEEHGRAVLTVIGGGGGASVKCDEGTVISNVGNGKNGVGVRRGRRQCSRTWTEGRDKGEKVAERPVVSLGQSGETKGEMPA